MADDDRERAAREIARAARATRNPLPRGLWIAALVVGIACTVAAVIAVTRSGDPASRSPTADHASGSRFGMGIAVGLGAGLVIGFSVGRGRRRAQPDHSSRKIP